MLAFQEGPEPERTISNRRQGSVLAQSHGRSIDDILGLPVAFVAVKALNVLIDAGLHTSKLANMWIFV